jgi:hypothetical protein
MKTTIISIAKSDDLYSIQDKLTWNKSGRVLLKLENDNATFLSRKEIALLVRYANSIGSHIGLVTLSRGIRLSAQRYGIPVFRTLREAQLQGWQQSKESGFRVDEQKRITSLTHIASHEKKLKKELPFILRFVIFLVSVFAVLSLVTFFIPSAEIEIVTEKSDQIVKIPIEANLDLVAIDLSGTLPILTKQLELNLSEQIQCTGIMDVPVSKAVGVILIQNLTETELSIPEGTVFSSSTVPGIRFESTESAVLSEGVNETIQVPIRAINPGLDGNLAAGAIDSVEGNLGLFITVSNVESLTGGENLSAHTPSKQDLAKLRVQLNQSLIAKAEDQFLAEQTDQEIFIPGSVNIVELTSESYEPEIDQPSEILKLEQQVVLEGWFLQQADVNQVIKTIMDAQLEEPMMAFDDEIQLEPSGSAHIRKDQVEWQFVATRKVVQSVPEDRLRKALAGIPMEKTGQQIEYLGLLENKVTIKNFPSWWQRMPFLENRIEVHVIESSNGN